MPGIRATVPPFDRFHDDRLGAIADICALIDPPEKYLEAFVRKPIRRFMRDVFLVPASEEDHDACPGGLVDHTLALSRRALEAVRPVDRANDPMDYKDRLALFAACLIHDVGKAFYFQVAAESPQGSEGWVSHNESFAAWAEKNLVQSLTMTPRPGRGKIGSSESISNLYLFQIFPLALRTLLGDERINSIQDALLHRMPKSKLDLLAIFKAADRDVTVESRAAIDLDRLGREVRSVLIPAILAEKGWNQAGRFAFASRSHVVLRFPTAQVKSADSGVWQEALDLIDQVAATNHNDNRNLILQLLRHDLVAFAATGDLERDLRCKCVIGDLAFLAVALPWSFLVPKGPIPEVAPLPQAIDFKTTDGRPTLVKPETLGFTFEGSTDQDELQRCGLVTMIWSQLVVAPLAPAELRLQKALDQHGKFAPRHLNTALEFIHQRLASGSSRKGK